MGPLKAGLKRQDEKTRWITASFAKRAVVISQRRLAE